MISSGFLQNLKQIIYFVLHLVGKVICEMDVRSRQLLTPENKHVTAS